MDHPKHIVITGPESSGKTTLASALALVLKGKLVTEYARDYLTILKADYSKRDLLNIAYVQEVRMRQEQERPPFTPIICDTDLLTIHIWWQVKYGAINDAIFRSWKQNLPVIYLMCAPDIPWVEDPLREHPDARENLFFRHIDEMKRVGVAYKIIKGSEQERLSCAIDIVKDIL